MTRGDAAPVVTSAKPDFVAALHELSGELDALFGARFGAVSKITLNVSSVENAIIVQGEMAKNFNNSFLAPLAGLPIVEAMLRSGQFNPAIQCLLLSMLQTTGATAKNDFAINFADGASYPVGRQQLIVKIIAGSASAVSAELFGASPVSFVCDKGADSPDFIGEFKVAEAGDYTLTVSAEFTETDKPESKTVRIVFSGAEEEEAEEEETEEEEAA